MFRFHPSGVGFDSVHIRLNSGKESRIGCMIGYDTRAWMSRGELNDSLRKVLFHVAPHLSRKSPGKGVHLHC